MTKTIPDNSGSRRKPRKVIKIRKSLKSRKLPSATQTSTRPIPYLQRFLDTSDGRPYLTDEEADTQCSSLGHDGLLRMLNKVEGTSITLGWREIYKLLGLFISRNYDFGTAYAHVRGLWPSNRCDTRCHFERKHCQVHTFPSIYEAYRDNEEIGVKWEQQRTESASKNFIILDEPTKPRRIWNLCVNRVIPTHYAIWYREERKGNTPEPSYAAISHSWVDPRERRDVETAVNAREWKVPLPNDVSLEDIRREVFNMKWEYAWLDVVCLRQQSEDNDLDKRRLRELEWKYDIPTIGLIYHNRRVVIRYCNGIGRALVHSGYQSQYHWNQRIWTLQEVTGFVTEAGLLHEASEIITPEMREHMEALNQTQQISTYRLRKTSNFTLGGKPFLLPLMLEMQRRFATKPLDKVVVLGTMLCDDKVPYYDETESPESAWIHLIEHIRSDCKVGLFFMLPYPGNGPCTWYPSWDQLIDPVLSKDAFGGDAWHPKIRHNSSGQAELSGKMFTAYFNPCSYHNGIATPAIEYTTRDGITSITEALTRCTIEPGEYLFIKSFQRNLLGVCSRTVEGKSRKVSLVQITGLAYDIPARMATITLE